MSTSFINHLYYEIGAPVYEKVLGAWTLGRWWRWQQRALEGLPTGAPILELGCGTGRLLEQRLRVGPVVGIDMAMPMLRQARHRLQDRARGAPILVADASRLPFRDGAFAAVISTGVLTAIDEAAPVLREAKRVLRSGGKMAFVEMMPPGRNTLASRAASLALRAARDQFHNLPALLGDLGIQAHDEEIGRAGTVHLVTAIVP